MKTRRLVAEHETQRLHMTPLIDIVFLLLTFFIMTLKIIAPEGDFGIKMPLRGADSMSVPEIDATETIPVRVLADEEGNLREILFAGENLGPSPSALRRRVVDYLGNAVSQEQRKDVQVQLDCDERLKYRYTVETITAISGYRSEGRVIPLVENITFAEHP